MNAPDAFTLYAGGVHPLRRRRSLFTPEAFTLYAGGVHHYAGGVHRLRRRRSLISARGWSAAKTLGHNFKSRPNPERVKRLANPFRVKWTFMFLSPGLSLRSNPGLKLANASGVIGERLRRN